MVGSKGALASSQMANWRLNCIYLYNYPYARRQVDWLSVVAQQPATLTLHCQDHVWHAWRRIYLLHQYPVYCDDYGLYSTCLRNSRSVGCRSICATVPRYLVDRVCYLASLARVALVKYKIGWFLSMKSPSVTPRVLYNPGHPGKAFHLQINVDVD